MWRRYIPAWRTNPGPDRLSPRATINARRPYAYLPPVQYRDNCHPAPTPLQEWLQEQAAITARVHYERRWGPNYQLPLDYFTSDQ